MAALLPRSIACGKAGPETLFRLERAQEINDLLLLLRAQLIESIDDFIGFAVLALVRLDGLHQVGSTPVMKKEDPLAYAPERRGSELVRTCSALRNPVRQANAHVMNQEVREKVHRLIGKRSAWTG